MAHTFKQTSYPGADALCAHCGEGPDKHPATAAHPVPGRRLYEQVARLPTRSEWTPDRVPFVKQDDVLALVRAAHDEAARYEIEAADYRKMYDDTRALLAEAVAVLAEITTVRANQNSEPDVIADALTFCVDLAEKTLAKVPR